MATSWPPATAPSWPPAGYQQLEFSTLAAAEIWARQSGIQVDNPRLQERTAFFDAARCDEGHTVTGRMIVIGGVRFPFARCDGNHDLGNGQVGRQFLVLWPPYTWGVS